MTHSGCGGGEKIRRERKERNTEGKVFTRGVRGEKGRKLAVLSLHLLFFVIFFILPLPSSHFPYSFLHLCKESREFLRDRTGGQCKGRVHPKKETSVIIYSAL